MSDTNPPCRREDSALCDPHNAAVKLKLHPAPSAPEQVDASVCEKQTMSEKQFLRSHTIYSAVSSWLFALAGATNIGVLIAYSSKVLSAAEKDRPISEALSNKKYNRIAIGMMAFGGLCMAVSNWLESKKVVTEWQLGAGKLQRKAAVAENKASIAGDADADAAQSKNWAASVQQNAPEPLAR